MGSEKILSMKGIIFTELIEMMEDLMGLEFTNKVIEDARLENEGAYTAIGTYPPQDMFKIMASLSMHAGNTPESLMKSYGEYLFYRIIETHKKELTECCDTFSFLQKLNNIVKMEVLKLNPKATIPSIKAKLLDKSSMEVLYKSDQQMADLIHGIMSESAKHFRETINIQQELLGGNGSRVKFLLKKKAHNE